MFRGFAALSVEISTNRSTSRLDRRLDEVARPEDVVRDGLHRIRLEHRDVLVRSGVEDDLRMVALEDRAHLHAVAAVGEHCAHRRVVALLEKLALDLEERRLALVDEHEPARAEPCELAAQLRADRAAGAGDHDDAILHVRRHELEIDHDLLAPEHVLDLHRTDLAREVEIARDQLVQARQRLHRDALRAAALDDALTHRAGRRRNRDQHLVGLVVAQEVRQVVGRAEHPHVDDARTALARVVVDEPDRRVRELAVALHLAHHQLARVAGAHDQHLLAARDDPGARPFDQAAREESVPGDECEQKQEVERRDAVRQP